MPEPCQSSTQLLDKIHRLELEVTRLQVQKEGSDTALILAREALAHNQAVSNEWRKENIDQRALFVTKVEFAGTHTALEARVAILEKDRNSIWVRALIIAGTIIGAVATIQHFWK